MTTKTLLKYCIFSFITIIPLSSYCAYLHVPEDFSNISNAIAASSDNDVILLNANYSPFFELNISIDDKKICIESVNGISTINAQEGGRHFVIDNSEVIMKNLNIINGLSSSPGGSINITESILTFDECNIAENSSQNIGGAIFSNNSDIVCRSTKFVSNMSNGETNATSGGGAIYCTSSDNSIHKLSLYNSKFSRNSSNNEGGAIIAQIDVLEIFSCDFDSNFVNIYSLLNTARGGAILCQRDVSSDLVSVTMRNSFFRRNHFVSLHDNPEIGSGGALSSWRTVFNIDSCQFINNGVSLDNFYKAFIGGAICSDLSTSHFPTVNCEITNSGFFGNQANEIGGAVYLSSTENAEQMSFENCSFVGNSVDDNDESGDSSGGAIYLSQTGLDAYCTSNGTYITNCLFTANGGLTGASVMTDCESISITFCTFSDNNTYDGSLSSDIFIRDSDSLVANLFLENSIIGYCSGDAILFDCPIESEIYIDATDIYGTLNDWNTGDLEIFVLMNLNTPPKFVSRYNNGNYDYNLKWDSPLLDQATEGSEDDYDLTHADIGWSQKYEEIEISGSVSLTQPGHYKIVGATVISGSGADTIIPAGSVIKSDLNHGCYIRDNNAANNYNITIGDLNGARTSIVGPYITIGYPLPSQEDMTNVHLTGVLFNQGTPTEGSQLVFKSCNVDVNGANDNVKFNNYDLSEILFYSNCTGRFRNFNFSDTHQGNDRVTHKMLDLYSFYSKIDVENITFGIIPDYYGFKMCLYGTVPGFETTHVMSNCIVDCSDNGNETYPVCINSATANFHHNIFNNIDVNGIYLTESSLRMTNGAYNTFNKSRITDYIGYPLIDGVDSDCSMWCGKNSFTHSLDLLTGYKYITINDADNWGHNYWGYSDCSSGTNPSSYLPFGVNCTPYYEDCPTPPFVPCTDQEEEISLFKLGQEANELRNYPAAIGYWTALLQDYPESEFCNDATSTIKAIGIMTEYGEESYSAIRTCLESAAITSDSVNVLLSIFQVCSAWCVEGRHGDRDAAIAFLDSLYQKEQGDKDKETLINTALAEIDTYPPQGQNSAMSLNGMLLQTIRLREKLGVLQRVSTPKGFRRNDAQETPNLITEPRDFRIETCYPNPFNPMTVITLNVSDVTPLCLEVYNSLGQCVRVLYDGPAQIGLRKFSFDASGLGAGLYIVRAEQGSQVDVKKMLYVK
jgi:hypothetical protein